MQKILITGGAGYIGSHTAIELINNGYEISVIDNLSNSNYESIRRVEKITGKQIDFYESDIRDDKNLDIIFGQNSFDAVIHFAGLKSVSESIAKPIDYYDNNINSTLVLLKTMNKFKVKKLIFSSSATVYGTPEKLPIKETCQTGLGITNPYGQTKFMIEQMLKDISISDSSLEISILRYFNPIGAHESGLIGEDPNGIPNNLLPFVSQVAVGKLKKLSVFGNDYNTPDGTCIRDYIHVTDLARGHVAALQNIKPGISIYNLGTGRGVSVLKIVKAFKEMCGKPIPYEIAPRRQGDLAEVYADTTKANQLLNWQATKSIKDACKDAWRWQSMNPNGYK